VLTKSDLAKYPFMPRASEYIKNLDLTIEDLIKPEYREILERAEDRIEEAILFGLVGKPSPKDDVEIISFPIAMMMVAATDDRFMKRRYALAEAKRISEFLREEKSENILEIAKVFNWRIRLIEVYVGSLVYEFALHFVDYLRNATNIQNRKWKLVNRVLLNGEVYLTRAEASRLLEEEVRRYIESKLGIKVGLLPEGIMKRVGKLKQLFLMKRREIRWEEIPKEVSIIAFPPCIKALYGAAVSGQRLSHMGRFTLTSFLINIGMTVENVVNMFRSVSDFDERMTRYQVEHIAGGRGSRTRYTAPRCDTLRTHGLCPGMDEICRKIRHPLTYYRRKLRAIKTKPSAVRT